MCVQQHNAYTGTAEVPGLAASPFLDVAVPLKLPHYGRAISSLAACRTGIVRCMLQRNQLQHMQPGALNQCASSSVPVIVLPHLSRQLLPSRCSARMPASALCSLHMAWALISKPRSRRAACICTGICIEAPTVSQRPAGAAAGPRQTGGPRHPWPGTDTCQLIRELHAVPPCMPDGSRKLPGALL